MAACFDDDFHTRARKLLQQKFRDSVIPSHLIPFLECLTKVDEERVLAKERHYGAILAADELFDLLIRRPNWTEDLKYALRLPDVGLCHLAVEIENLQLEVPMRWDISGMEDTKGSACFDGNCISGETLTVRFDEMNIGCSPTEHDEVDSQTTSTSALPNYPDSEQRMEELKEETAVKTVVPVTDDHQSFSTNTTDIAARRENVRLNAIDTIFRTVTKFEQIPLALKYIESVNLHLKGVEKGSILFKVKVTTLEDLERLQQLVRYGGMKKILDQELLDKNMEVLKDLAKSENLELIGFRSKLYFHETDLERCKAVLMSLEDGRPMLENIDGHVMDNFKGVNDVLKQKQLKEILPPVCMKLIEDPFIKERLSSFFREHAREVTEALKRSVGCLLKKEISEAEGITLDEHDSVTNLRGGPESRESISELFFEWVTKEVSAILETLNMEDLQFLLNYSAVQLLNDIDAPESIELRYRLQPTEEGNRTHKEEKADIFAVFPKSKFLVLQPVDKKIKLSLELSRIISRSRGDYAFVSMFLRDTVFAYLIDTYDIVSKIDKSKARKCEFLPLAIRLFCKDEDHGKSLSFSAVDEIRRSFAFEAKIIALPFVWSGFPESLFPAEKVISFSLLDSLGLITNWKKGIIEIQCTISEDIAILVDCSNVFQLRSGIPTDNSELNISLNLKGIKFLLPRSLQRLSQFLGMSKRTTRLGICSCGTCPDNFSNYLQTGNFANITHLNLSDTRIIQNASEPLMLRYLPRLLNIDLHGCSLGDTGIIILGREFALLKSLKEINVAKNQISAEGLQELSNSLALHHGLTSLRLQNNNLGPEGGVVLSGWLKRLSLIETLNISACNLEDMGVKHISKAVLSPVLRQLSMRDNNVTTNGSLVFLKNMQTKRMIEHLDYGKNKVFEEVEQTQIESYAETSILELELELFSFLSEKEHWSHLSFWSCNLGAYRVFQSYKKFRGMKDLVHLCLQSNTIDDMFAEDIGGCLKEHCEHIRHINLRHNRIGNSGALAIADGISGKKKLEELFLDKNQIEEIGVRKLLSASLQVDLSVTLDVSCNNLAKFDIDRLVAEHSLQETHSGNQKYDKDKPNKYVSHDYRLKAQIYM